MIIPGKSKCRAMKKIRSFIADKIGHPEVVDTSECPNQGPCAGTCPACQAEDVKLSELLDAYIKENGDVCIDNLQAFSINGPDDIEELNAKFLAEHPIDIQDSESTLEMGEFTMPGIMAIGDNKE